MKLSDIDARFAASGGEGITDKDGNPVPRREGIGLLFDCPKCGESHPGFVPFANPLDGGPNDHSQGWQRTGDTIDTMTLTPSILRRDCGWHGFFTNGEVVSC